MVLEDESSDDNSSLPYMYSETSTDGLNQVPFSLEDPDYKGLELDLMAFYEKHGKPSERLVEFEGTMTGRRFLACAEPEGQNCGFVQWVDEQWPPTMENPLLKLWSMVEESNCARENRVVDFSYLQSNITYQQQCRAELVAGMKAEMAKKDVATEKLQQKYELLCNLTSAQATVIQNLKLKNMKEKELLSEATMNLELKNAEFRKFEEKLTQEKLELKFQVADLLKLKENHNEEKQMQKFKITELTKAEEKLKEKIKGIQAILQN
ncbi:uncharacterized protein [Aegilops tauschii subsp. strangulata]|uniref:uncharacterized protein n=1 Tax=Aegilops tauschii subsp. strangulata TaxID=200361 RepID=UPI00098A5694|nr:uncharacterized protein LOC109738425 [Aegilops tauschii subsp. strangulata]